MQLIKEGLLPFIIQGRCQCWECEAHRANRISSRIVTRIDWQQILSWGAPTVALLFQDGIKYTHTETKLCFFILIPQQKLHKNRLKSFRLKKEIYSQSPTPKLHLKVKTKRIVKHWSTIEATFSLLQHSTDTCFEHTSDQRTSFQLALREAE